MEHENDGDTNCNRRARYSHQRIGTETRGLGNKRTGRDHPNYCIVGIGQNTKKNPGNLRKELARLERRKITSTWEYCKRAPRNKQRRKKKSEKSTSEEDNFSKHNSETEISSKE